MKPLKITIPSQLCINYIDKYCLFVSITLSFHVVAKFILFYLNTKLVEFSFTVDVTLFNI